jgi:hypothetical protein
MMRRVFANEKKKEYVKAGLKKKFFEISFNRRSFLFCRKIQCHVEYVEIQIL